MISKQELKSLLNEDPHWASFLYLTDELSVAESDQFEDQLAEREDLQQALIDTTRQLACLSGFEALPIGADGTRPSLQPGHMEKWSRVKAIAVIASLAACVTIAVLVSNDQATPEAFVAGSSSPVKAGLETPEVDVLQAWVNIQSEEVVAEEMTVERPSELSVPDWMLTAVLLEAEDLNQFNDPSGRIGQPLNHSDSI